MFLHLPLCAALALSSFSPMDQYAYYLLTAKADPQYPIVTPGPDDSLAKEELEFKLKLEKALIRQGRLLELLNPKEGLWGDLNYSVDVMRCVYSTCPPLSDRDRFPPKKELEELLSFSQQHIKYLEAMTASYPTHDSLQNQLVEAKRLNEGIQNLLVAYGGYSMRDKREGLKAARCALGIYYYRGGTPPAMPYWRYGIEY